MIEKRFFSLEEAARYYGYPSANAVRMALLRGSLPKQAARRLGRKVLLDREVIDRYILERDESKQMRLF